MKFTAKTCRGFATACMLCATVSLFFGGMLLDIVGFVFGGIAYANARKIVMADANDSAATSALKLSRNALIFCAVAAALNIVTAIVLVPSVVGSVASSGASGF